MNTQRWSLPASTVLVPVDQLKEQVRRNIEHEEGDFALSIPHSRLRTRIVGLDAAMLLRRFQEPKALVEAIALEAVDKGLKAEDLLRDAFPLLKSFIDEGYLLPEHAAGVESTSFSLEVGASFQGFRVERRIALVADTEIYRLEKPDGGRLALKLSREGGLAKIERIFRREAEILSHLEGRLAPRLYEEGLWNERRFLIMDWLGGINSEIVADRLRALPAVEQRQQFKDFFVSIARAYSELHLSGVIHGDIHSGNIFVEGDRVRLIDFGMARMPESEGVTSRARRGGIEYYADPEYVAARLVDKSPPQSSFAAEQYSLAALLYYFLTDSQYLEFGAEKKDIYQQIAQSPPLSICARRLAPWPDLEAVLHRALQKQPEDRYPSVADMAEALSNISLTAPGDAGGARSEAEPVETFLEDFLGRLDDDQALRGSVASKAPKCSVFYGSAGMAYAVYRLATSRNSPALLSLADVWCARARNEQEQEGAFFEEDGELTRRNLGDISFFHSPPGPEFVNALLAASRGDIVTLQSSCTRFVEMSRQSVRTLELTMGRASSLLACALLLDAMAEFEIRDEVIYRFGNQVHQDLTSRLAELPPISECRQLPSLGIAHGWGGILYSLILWRRYSAAVTMDGVEERLQQLASLAQPYGEGVRWPRRIGLSVDRDYFSGWCNGTAGFVPLWILAHRRWHDEAYADLALRSAIDVWNDESDELGDLCCGYAGRAYALLSQYRFCGEKVWLERARQQATKAVERVRKRNLKRDSLFKGEPGVAVLAADLSTPESAAMPLFDPVFS